MKFSSAYSTRMTCERTFIHAQSTLRIAPQNLPIYVMEHRLWDEFLLQLGFVEWKIELDKISRKD